MTARTNIPRLVRNSALLPPIQIELDHDERNWVANRILAIPPTARIQAERDLLRRMRAKRSGLVRLRGSDRFYIIHHINKSRKSAMLADLMDKVRS